MAKFRKKPVVVDAEQWFPGKAVDGVIHPVNDDGLTISFAGLHGEDHGWIETLEGGHVVSPGDWIITGIKGEKYPCKPDIFAATYEPAEAI
jgi:hypothetical protein